MSESQTKICTVCKNQFEIMADDFGFYEKMGVPVPNLCPECRFKRRALFRNEITLYSRKCDLCSQSIVSMYNPKSPYTIYCEKCYESDAWDPYSFGQEYDSNKSFFEQLGELLKRVPKKSTMISTSSNLGPNVNSQYTNFAGGNKDCYLIFNGGGNENVMYSRGVSFSRDTLDAYFGVNLEKCYEVVNVDQSSGVMFSQNVVGSMDSTFLLGASGCQHCFGCVNLRHKTYHFFNEPFSKEEYEKKVHEIKGSYRKMLETQKRFEEFSLKFPRRENNNLKTMGSTGDYLFESKNLRYCFETTRCEDSKYLFSIKFSKDSYDLLGFGYDSELLLECVATGYSNRVIGGFWVENSQNIEYSSHIRSSQHCFGCDGLKNVKYCILNKRYSEEEYATMRENIIEELKRRGQYGLYAPPSVAPFGYNETVGQYNIPLTKKEVLAQGFRWEDDLQITRGKETMTPEQLPDHISDVAETIVNEVLVCVGCGRNYRITTAELQFYRRMVLPIPRRCFYCRYADRLCRRGPFKFYSRNCAKCEKGIQTTYAPNRPEIVYCEECYQREVI
jgi:hypothetical protein